jgi:hypothetical protein
MRTANYQCFDHGCDSERNCDDIVPPNLQLHLQKCILAALAKRAASTFDNPDVLSEIQQRASTFYEATKRRRSHKDPGLITTNRILVESKSVQSRTTMRADTFVDLSRARKPFSMDQ